MVAQPRIRPQPKHPTSDALDQLELLRLRGSDDELVRAVALFGSLLLRKLDGLAKSMESA